MPNLSSAKSWEPALQGDLPKVCGTDEVQFCKRAALVDTSVTAIPVVRLTQVLSLSARKSWLGTATKNTLANPRASVRVPETSNGARPHYLTLSWLPFGVRTSDRIVEIVIPLILGTYKCQCQHATDARFDPWLGMRVFGWSVSEIIVLIALFLTLG